MAVQALVIGLGRFGSTLARELSRLGNDVLAIDIDEKRVSALEGDITRLMILDARDENLIASLGVPDFNACVVSIGADLAASVIVCQLLKKSGAKRVIAKSSSDRHTEILQHLGIDEIVSPERESAVKLASRLGSASFIDLIELSPTHSIVEIRAKGEVLGKTLKEADIRRRWGLHVISINRGGVLIIAPGPDERLEEGDVLAVLGSYREIEAFEAQK